MTHLLCEFTIPGYVQPKQRTFGNRFVTPPETRQYEKTVGQIAKLAMKGGAAHRGFVGLTIDIICQVPQSWTRKKKEWALAGKIFPTHCDLDNQIKCINDGLNKIVFEDDRFVNSLIVRREYGTEDKAIVKVVGMNELARGGQPTACELNAVTGGLRTKQQGRAKDESPVRP